MDTSSPRKPDPKPDDHGQRAFDLVLVMAAFVVIVLAMAASQHVLGW